MKNLRKLISVFLAVAMLASMFVVSADTTVTLTDIDSATTVGKSVTELIKLGIINGYPDGTFKPDNTITRAEFAKVVTTFLNIAQIASDTLPSGFADVDDINHWGKKYVKLAVDRGIVNGYEDGTFRPDAPVKYVEAVKMLVASLGYTVFAQQYQTPTGPWYQGYMGVAAEKGILNGAAVNSVEDPASRGTVAVLVYNCLKVEVAQENIDGGVSIGTGTTALEQLLGKKEITGVITGVYQTGLNSGTSGLNKNEVIIETATQTYTCKVASGTDTLPLLGYRVSAYLEEDEGEYLLSQITRTSNNKITKIKSVDVEYSDANKIEFWESDSAKKTTQLRFSDNLKVIYNGKQVSTSQYGPADFDDVTSGEIVLLSNDNNEEIDVAFITSYEIFVVSSKVVNSDQVKLYGMYGVGEKIVPVNPSNYIYSVTYNNDPEYDPANIQKWDVVSIQESHPMSSGKKVFNVIVTRKTANGSIKEKISESELNINDKIYEVSQSLVRSTHADKPQFKVSDSVTVYLDHEGKIAAAATSSISVSVYLGYLVNAQEPSGVDGYASVLLYGITGKQKSQTFALAERVRVDGAAGDGDHSVVLNKLKASAAVANATKITAGNTGLTLTDYAQLIRYTVNAAGKIDSIDTIAPNATASDDDLKQTIAYPSVEHPTIKYTGAGAFQSGSKSIFNANSNTKVLVIPDSVLDLDNYSVKTYSSTFSTGVPYNIEVYNKNQVDVAKYLIVYGGNSSDTTFNENSPFVITRDITGVEGGDKLKGWALADGANIDGLVSLEEGTFMNNLAQGSIFRYTKNSAGEALAVEKLLGISGNTVEMYNGLSNVLAPVATSELAANQRQIMFDDTPRTAPNSKNRFYFGTVVGREGTQISLTNTLYTDTCGITEDIKETFTINESNAKVYIYDFTATRSENFIEVGGSLDTIRTVRDLQASGITDMSGATQVLVYCRSNVVKAIIIFRR